MAKIKNIPCDIFKRDIDVFIGSYEELCKYAKKHLKKDPLLDEITDNTPDYAACFYFRADGTGIIHLLKFPTTPEEIGHASHESLHAAMRLCWYCGVDYTPGAPNETFTYLQEWILLNILTKKGYKKV